MSGFTDEKLFLQIKAVNKRKEMGALEKGTCPRNCDPFIFQVVLNPDSVEDAIILQPTATKPLLSTSSAVTLNPYHLFTQLVNSTKKQHISFQEQSLKL